MRAAAFVIGLLCFVGGCALFWHIATGGLAS